MATIDPHLGILVNTRPNHVSATNPPFVEAGYFKALTKYGKKRGLEVTVFCPRYTDWANNRIRGFRYDIQHERWKVGWYPPPTLLYDRIFYTTKRTFSQNRQCIQRLISKTSAHMLGYGLPGKWQVYQMIADNHTISPFLPTTIRWNGLHSWKQHVKKAPLCIKPISGSQGSGVCRISQVAKTYFVEGHFGKNKKFTRRFPSANECERWMQHYYKRRPCIIQPFLPLHTTDRTPFDIRVLVQKDGRGKWVQCGQATRVGKSKGLISNLHNGGKAMDVQSFLRDHYSDSERADIIDQINRLAEFVPTSLEEKHGRLIELGLDIGVEPSGKTWLLEVNSKPGRKSFRLLQNRQALLDAILNPLRYACYMLKTMEGTMNG